MELYLNEIYYHWLIWFIFIFKRPILKVYLQMHLDANKAELDKKNIPLSSPTLYIAMLRFVNNNTR